MEGGGRYEADGNEKVKKWIIYNAYFIEYYHIDTYIDINIGIYAYLIMNSIFFTIGTGADKCTSFAFILRAQPRGFGKGG